MPVETATYVADLNANNPVAGDGLAQADDQMRLTKAVLKNTFPNLTGAVTSTHTQLNVLATMTYPLVAADLASNSVPTAKLVDANVTTAKIADANVTTPKIADANVTTPKIADLNVTTAKLADLNVTTAKIADANVTKAKIENIAHGKVLARLTASAGVVEECIIPFNQCRLAKVSANLVLSPCKGNLLTINSCAETVPDAGVSLAPTGTPSTLYYIYAYMSGSTMTLEASTTVPAVQAGTGISIKTGDATRTLVGMAYPTTGPAWTDSATQRFVRSWFNDPGISFLNRFTATRSTASATYVEVNSEIRSEFLCWTGETVIAGANGKVGGVANSNCAETTIGFDGTTAEDTWTWQQTAASLEPGPMAIQLFKTDLTEGYHYITLLGKALNGTAWYPNTVNAAGTRTTLRGFAKL